MTEQGKNNTGSKKSGRFDFPSNLDQTNNTTNTNNTNDANTAANNAAPRNRFSDAPRVDVPNKNNNNAARSRVERYSETRDNFASTRAPQESQFAANQTTNNESRSKVVGGKFATEIINNENDQPQQTYQTQFNREENNSPTMQTMQTKQTPSQTQQDTTQSQAVTIKKYLLPIDSTFEVQRLGVLLCLILPITIYSYFLALEQIVYDWINNVDYSHGFFVIPLVAVFLYSRLDSYPGTRYRLCWLGLIPVALCVFMRAVASRYYMDALEEWSLFFWVIGMVWFFYGTRAFLWALPSLCFLLFMFQLPFSYDVFMKHNLQLYAAKFAAVLLQILGEPAIAINNIIRVKGEILSVEAACSGIRFLISVFAIASAAVLFMRKPWWQNVIVMLIAAPLAMFVNASRITMTGILLLHHREFLAQFTSKEQVHVLADEVAGYTMILVVAVLFLLFLIYMDKVFKRVSI